MLLIGIDGASRRNGKENCLAAGAALFFNVDTGEQHFHTVTELGSTNQRAELLALIEAMEHVTCLGHSEFNIVTDSEYLFNAVRKEWYCRWDATGWKTADGSDVKNKDLWEKVLKLHNKLIDEGYDWEIFHVKGHTVSIGKVTGKNLILQDSSAKVLRYAVEKKVDELLANPLKVEIVEHMKEVFIRNHNMLPQEYVIRMLLVVNNTVDILAGHAADEADAKYLETLR